jgi:hypothetical protein
LRFDYIFIFLKFLFLLRLGGFIFIHFINVSPGFYRFIFSFFAPNVSMDAVLPCVGLAGWGSAA